MPDTVRVDLVSGSVTPVAAPGPVEVRAETVGPVVRVAVLQGGRFEPEGAVAAHEAAPDPHPQYRTRVHRTPDGTPPAGTEGDLWLVQPGAAEPATYAAALRAVGIPAAYYPLTAEYGTRDVIAGRNATNHGVAFTDKGAVFDGASYLEIPDAALFSVPTTGELTIVVGMTVADWEDPTGASEFCHWLAKGADGQQEWAFRHYYSPDTSGEDPPRPKRTSVYAFNPAGGLGAGSYFQDDDPAGVERVVAGMIWGTSADGGSTQIWKDGVLRDTDLLSGYAITPVDGTAPVRVGTRDRDVFFRGTLRHLSVWPRKLTQAELLSLAAAADRPAGNWAAGTTTAPATFFTGVKDTFETGFAPVWATVNNAVVTGGQCRITAAATAGSRINTNFAFTLKNSSVSMRISGPVDTTGGDSNNTYSRVRIYTAADSTTMLDIILRPVAGTIHFRNVTGNVDAVPGSGAALLPYDPVAHAWVRFREAAGRVYWETSPDGASWAVRRSDPTPAWLTAAADQRLYIESLKTLGTTGSYTIVDNVNQGSATDTAAPVLRVNDGGGWVQVAS